MQILTVAERVISQIFRDKRTIAMMFLAPLFVLFLLSTILGSSSDDVTIGTVDVPSAFADTLASKTETQSFKTEAEGMDAINDQRIEALITYQNGQPEILIEGGDVSKNAAALQVIQETLITIQGQQATATNTKLSETVKQLQQRLTELTNQTFDAPSPVVPPTAKPDIQFLYGSPDAELFDQIAPALMGFFIFLFVFIIAGVSFLRERSSGTLERTLATPLKRSSIVFGYFVGFFLFVTIQTILIQLFIVNVLNVTQEGNYFLLLFVNLLTASVALSLGLLLSSFSRTEFQLIQFIPLAIVPQIFFSGLFDLTDAPTWVEVINRLMPLTYAADALQNIMIRGAGFTDIWIDLIVLTGFMTLFVLLNMRALKKQRPV
ncbi:ABC transporter [Exiguobacterium sp. KRL4]|uniref:ABC transporter permease n=1 Tax=Exiguobacterium antarcticum TaxID=132920 RepID=A0ABT6R350_9BACL|nr:MULTISPECIES: ABC transporter permease [Exiguobacterium]MDI3235372.1 ABC transporter permease [Exiguobacterium antarcticum]OIN68172.1 ABC transporter [Exiguobacterium sp. KRL4]